MGYTIAIDVEEDWLAACALDGDKVSLDRQLSRYRARAEHGPEIEIIGGLILTNEKPADEALIKWSGDDRGIIVDIHGSLYRYAIRYRRYKPLGEANGRAKLRRKDVDFIKESDIKQLSLAAMFGVHASRISRIKSKKEWVA